MKRQLGWPIALALALAGCSTPPTPAQQAQITAGVTAVATLASIAAANNTTTAALVAQGALFCQALNSTGAGTSVFALANAEGAPVSVTNQASAVVAQTCAVLGAMPVAPPAAAASVPLVPVPATSLPAVPLAPASK